MFSLIEFHPCKVIIYKYVLCWLLFRVKFNCNLFNLVYPVIVVGICYKGCVIVRESVKTQASEARRVFAGISRLCIPRKGTCALHITRMPKVSPKGFSQVSHDLASREKEACDLHMIGMPRVSTDGDNWVSRVYHG